MNTEHIMAKRKKRRKLVRKPRNLVMEDGLPWFQRGGRLWGTYRVGAEYMGIAPNSFATFVWRHNLKSIKHGRRSLVAKDELDEKSGVVRKVAPLPRERIPFA